MIGIQIHKVGISKPRLHYGIDKPTKKNWHKQVQKWRHLTLLCTQIRVHLADAGHAILGDEVYGLQV